MIGYVPTSGPIELGDQVDTTGRVRERGAVMNALFSTPCFSSSVGSLMSIHNVEQRYEIDSYQSIMRRLSKGQYEKAEAVALIGALEGVLMYLVDSELYVVGGYAPCLSVVVSGLRYTWVNPFSWMNPFNYFGENSDKVYQLLYEFDQLSDIADRYDSGLAWRLKVTSKSYLHWRKGLLILCVVRSLI